MDNPGHISRAGDPDVRCTLYVAANAMMTRSSRWSPLKVWGMQLARQRGHKRAVVAVARKLAVILHRMRLDGTTYRWGTEGAP
jgi:transposase